MKRLEKETVKKVIIIFSSTSGSTREIHNQLFIINQIVMNIIKQQGLFKTHVSTEYEWL